jgi:DNA-binding NarL/FixJ family response regulator
MTPGTSSPRIRVLCVDDHRIVREGLRMIIDSEPDMVVIGSAANGHEAVTRYEEHTPDITLMDLQLPEMGGVDAIRAIRQIDAGARIIVLTMYKGDEDIHRALAAGASTYLLKDTLADDLPRIVREVHGGRQTLPPDVQARLEERAASPTLTPREVEVMRLVAAGRRDKEIAVALAISSQTARVHMKNIFAKLGVSDRTEAMSVAIRRGIIHID